MAGKTLGADQIRKILELSARGLSIRGISQSFEPKISRTAVRRYLDFVRNNLLKTPTLLKMDDEELDKVFNRGDPAYTDKRMEVFLSDIPFFEKEREIPGISVFIMWLNYTERHKVDHYGLTQFRFHLSQTGLLPKAYGKDAPGTLKGEEVRSIVTIPTIAVFYTDTETGWVRKTDILLIYMVDSSYIKVYALKSLDIRDVVDALNDILFQLGGTPGRLVTDNLRGVACRPDGGEPTVSSIIRHMHWYYGCTSSEPSAKVWMGTAVKEMETAINHINHMLCESRLYSHSDVESALQEFETRYNRTRVRGRDWSREEAFIKEERPRLKPLPEAPYEIAQLSRHTPARDGTIQVGTKRDTGYYSLPVTYIGAKVQCLTGEDRIAILDMEGQLVTVHSKVRNYNYSLKKEHIEEWERSVYNNLGILVEEASKKGRNVGIWMEMFFQKMLEEGHHKQECVRKHRNIMLKANNGNEALMDSFCAECLHNHNFSYGNFIGAFERFKESRVKSRIMNSNMKTEN